MLLTIEEWQAIRLTLLVAAAAVAVSLPFGILLGWLLAKRQFRGKFLLETAVNLPLVVPPVVTGYFLLVLFGRNGVLGSFFDAVFGIHFVFDWKGAVLASAIVGFPLLVRPIRLAFSSVDNRLIQTARTLGASPLDAFWTVTLPLARSGILGGCILSFARGLGEFGATIMIAGSIPGRTRTISLLIYSLLDAPGGMANSIRIVIVSIIIAAGALLASEALERYGRRRLMGASSD